MKDRELDALIAEKVMGWKLLRVRDESGAVKYGEWFENWVADGGKGPGMYEPREWMPSTDLEAAWKVGVEVGRKLRRLEQHYKREHIRCRQEIGIQFKFIGPAW